MMARRPRVFVCLAAPLAGCGSLLGTHFDGLVGESPDSGVDSTTEQALPHSDASEAPDAAADGALPDSQASEAPDAATDATDARSAPPPPGACSDVLTQHYDEARSGVQTCEKTISTTSVGSLHWTRYAPIGKTSTTPPDFATNRVVYTQPLFLNGVTLQTSSGPLVTNVIYVGDSHGCIWYFDAGTLLPIAGMPEPMCLDPAGGNYYDRPSSGMPVGIMGTPVIDPRDRAHPLMYVVNKSWESHNPDHAIYRLHMVDLGTMQDRVNIPVLAPNLPGCPNSVFAADAQIQRPALLIGPSFDRLYLAFGNDAHIPWGGEGAAYQHGWLMTYDVSAKDSFGFPLPQITNAYCSSRGGEVPGAGGIGNVGIWMAGAGPAMDSAGNVYVTTANGLNDANNDANSFVQFNHDGAKIGQFITPESSFQSGSDMDFGSSGAVIVGPTDVVAGGKSGFLFDLDTAQSPLSATSVAATSSGFVDINPTNCASPNLCQASGAPIALGTSSGTTACCPMGCVGSSAQSTLDLIRNANNAPCAKALGQDPAGKAGPYRAGIRGAPVVLNASVHGTLGRYIYYWGEGDYLRRVLWNPTTHSLGAPEQVGNVRLPTLPDGSVIEGGAFLSAIQTSPRPIIFAVAQRYGSPMKNNQQGIANDDTLVYAFDATGTAEPPLWTGPSYAGFAAKFPYPIVANGALYFMNGGSFDGTLYWPQGIVKYEP